MLVRLALAPKTVEVEEDQVVEDGAVDTAAADMAAADMAESVNLAKAVAVVHATPSEKEKAHGKPWGQKAKRKYVRRIAFNHRIKNPGHTLHLTPTPKAFP